MYFHIKQSKYVHIYSYHTCCSSSVMQLRYVYICSYNTVQICTSTLILYISLIECRISLDICKRILSVSGWRRPIRCLKWQVIFRTTATNHRALLRKMTYKDKASYGSSPPCNICKHILIL